MEGYEERTDSIRVPKNTGVDGFLKTLRRVLTLPRVQVINIDSSGMVSYTRIVREGEPPEPVDLDFSDLSPWSIVRNGTLEEFTVPHDAPATATIARLFNLLTQESLVPVAWVTGANSDFWAWHEETAGVRLTRQNMAYGVPIYTDREVPDHSLILCAAYTKGTTLVGCHRFLVVSMASFGGQGEPPAETEVSIL